MSTDTETTGPRDSGVVRAAGLFSVALLVLTACGDNDEADESSEDGAQGEVDPEGAQDQGHEPDEIAEDEDGDPPQIEEIADDIWNTMENSESAVMEATRPLDPEELEGLAEPEDVDDDATLRERYSGQADGSALTVLREAEGAEAEYITFDGETYLRGEHELEAFLDQYPGEFEEAELRQEFEGKWVEYTDFFPEGFSITEQLAVFRESFEEFGGFGELEGTAEERDGEEVWVYTDENREFVVRAGEDPVLLSVFAENDGEVVEATFSDWDEAEEPEKPDEEDILTMEDLEGLLN